MYFSARIAVQVYQSINYLLGSHLTNYERKTALHTAHKKVLRVNCKQRFTKRAAQLFTTSFRLLCFQKI